MVPLRLPDLFIRCCTCDFIAGWNESCQLWVCGMPRFQERCSYPQWSNYPALYILFNTHSPLHSNLLSTWLLAPYACFSIMLKKLILLFEEGNFFRPVLMCISSASEDMFFFFSETVYFTWTLFQPEPCLIKVSLSLLVCWSSTVSRCWSNSCKPLEHHRSCCCNGPSFEYARWRKRETSPP